MSEITEQELETVARAICEAHGWDAVGENLKSTMLDAKTYIAAYRAIEVMRLEKMRASWLEMERAYEERKRV